MLYGVCVSTWTNLWQASHSHKRLSRGGGLPPPTSPSSENQRFDILLACIEKKSLKYSRCEYCIDATILAARARAFGATYLGHCSDAGRFVRVADVLYTTHTYSDFGQHQPTIDVACASALKPRNTNRIFVLVGILTLKIRARYAGFHMLFRLMLCPQPACVFATPRIESLAIKLM